MMPNHYGLAPCEEQPGRQGWHLRCAVRHPVRFLRQHGIVHVRREARP